MSTAGLGGPGRPPHPEAGPGQTAMFDVSEHYGPGSHVPLGPVGKSVLAAIAAADLTAVQAATSAIAVELARAVDVAAAKSDTRGVVTAARELREALTALLPAPKGGGGDGDGGDALGQVLAGLAVPQVEVGHPAHA